MRTLSAVIVLLVAIHLLAATGGFIWLAASDRLDRGRVEQVVDLFRPTIAEQARLEAEQQQAEEQALATQSELAYMESVGNGPRSLEERLAQKLEGDDYVQHSFERMREDRDAIQTRLNQDRAFIDSQLQRLETERAAFEAIKKDYEDRRTQEDFQRAVATFEQLKPKQTKQMFQQLIASGQTDLVVDYLAEMSLRKSAGVLKEFKSPAEVGQASAIIEALRQRGKNMTNPQLAEASSP